MPALLTHAGAVLSRLQHRSNLKVLVVVAPAAGCCFTRAHQFQVAVAGAALLFVGNLVMLLCPGQAAAMYCGLVLLGLSYGTTSSALWGSMGMYAERPEWLGLVFAIPYCAFNCGALVFSIASGALLDRMWAVLTLWCCISGLAVAVALLWLGTECKSAQQQQHEVATTQPPPAQPVVVA